ncbi:352_t:CDS:1, partial [Acaulospora colombiana]
MPEKSSDEGTNNHMLAKRLSVDVIAAALAAFSVSPFIKIID